MIKAIHSATFWFFNTVVLFVSHILFIHAVTCTHMHLFHLPGCVKHMNEMDSRSFGVVLRNCRFQCDFHLVLQEAEDRFKRSQQLEKTSHTLTRAPINTHSKIREHSTRTNEDNKRSKREKHRLSHQPSDGCESRRPHSLPQCLWDCGGMCTYLKCLESSFDRTRLGEQNTHL